MTKRQLRILQRFFKFLLNRYKIFKTKRVDLSDTNVQKSVQVLLSKVRYAFIITQSIHDTENLVPEASFDSKRGCSARYVQPIVEWNNGDFKIWIGTASSSRKATEIVSNPNVTIAIGNDRAGANLIIHGIATIHTDQALRSKYWKPEWRLFFPQGPQDPDYIAICVEPNYLELLDLGGNIIPEPFGLQAMKLIRKNHQWTPVSG